MNPLQIKAIQDAIDASTDPQVRLALRQFRSSGMMPTGNQAAMAALSMAYMANGLPDPARVGGASNAVDSGYGTGSVSMPPAATPQSPTQKPADMLGSVAAPLGSGFSTGSNSIATNAMRSPDLVKEALTAGTSAGGDNTDPYAPAAAGAQGNKPAGTTAAAPAPGGTTAAAPTPGGTHVNPDPAAAASASTATNGHLDPSLFYGKSNPEGQISLFNQMLLKLGVDPTNPGLFGGAIIKRLMPIFDNMQTVGGLGAGKLWSADPLGGMNELASVLQTKGVSGLQDMGNAVLGNMHNLVGDNRDPAQQMAVQNAALGLSAEAMNPYMQQGMAQQSANARTLYSLANSVGPDGKMTGMPTNYLDYLNSRNDNGAYKGLLDLLNGAGR